MPNKPELKSLLQKILTSYAHVRAGYISELQNKIWDDTDDSDEDLTQVLADLTSDLNFYESDPRDRDEALGYYGDEHLTEVVNAAIAAIDKAA